MSFRSSQLLRTLLALTLAALFYLPELTNLRLPSLAEFGTVRGQVLPTLTIGDVMVREGNTATSTASFPVTLSAPAADIVTVDFMTSSVTATSGQDFATAMGTVTFQIGESSKAVDVTIIGDTFNERPETFSVVLTGPSGATIADGTGIGTISDDEDKIIELDGDTKSELAVYHQASGLWYFRNSATGTVTSLGYGGPGYTPLPGDYDGDGITDVAVYHLPSGLWFVRNSTTLTTTTTGFGGTDYAPVRGDFDGDGKTDLAVFHATSGLWFVKKSSDGSLMTVGYGGTGYTPVPADYDGDGTTDIAVYHPSSGLWFVRNSSTLSTTTTGFGGTDYTPVRGDFDGDGKTDLAVFHAPSGLWFIQPTSDGGGTVTFGYGGPGYTPVVGKYDADGPGEDGRADIAVYHPPSGLWFLRNSTSGVTTTLGFGGTGYTPLN